MVNLLLLGIALLIALLMLARWYAACEAQTLVKALKWLLLTLAMIAVMWLVFSGKLWAALAALPAVLVWFARLFSGLRFAKMFTGQGRGDSTGEAPPSSPGTGTMSRSEALRVLGLKDNATPDEIKAAHRHLMSQVHPDVGGTDYLAQQINQAKDVLLGQ